MQTKTSATEVSLITNENELLTFSDELEEFTSSHPLGLNFYNDLPRVKTIAVENELQVLLIRYQSKLLGMGVFRRVRPTSNVFTSYLGRWLFRQYKFFALVGDSFVASSSFDLDQVTTCGLQALSEKFDRKSILHIKSIPKASWLEKTFTSWKPFALGWSLFLPSWNSRPYYWINVQGDFSLYLRSLTPRTRQRIKNDVSRFGRKFPVTRFEVVEQVDAVKEFLTAVNVIYRDSWQGKQQHQLTGTENARNNETSIRNYEFLAKQGLLRSYLLRVNCIPIAYVIGYAHNSKYYPVEAGYLPEYGFASPGKYLWYQIIEDIFASRKFTTIDFGWGDQDYKRWFANECKQVNEIYLMRFGVPWIVLFFIGLANTLIRGIVEKLPTPCKNVLKRIGRKFMRR